MREAFRDKSFAMGPFAVLYELLAPARADVNTNERLWCVLIVICPNIFFLRRYG